MTTGNTQNQTHQTLPAAPVELSADVQAKIAECVLSIRDCVGFIMPERREEAEECVSALLAEVLTAEREPLSQSESWTKAMREDLRQTRQDFYDLSHSEPTLSVLVRFLVAMRRDIDRQEELARTEKTCEEWGPTVLWWAEERTRRAETLLNSLGYRCGDGKDGHLSGEWYKVEGET